MLDGEDVLINITYVVVPTAVQEYSETDDDGSVIGDSETDKPDADDAETDE